MRDGSSSSSSSISDNNDSTCRAPAPAASVCSAVCPRKRVLSLALKERRIRSVCFYLLFLGSVSRRREGREGGRVGADGNERSFNFQFVDKEQCGWNKFKA